MTQTDERLPFGLILSYGLAAFSINAIWFTVGIYLPNYYTDQIGITAGMLSWVFLIGRIWDAVTDPTMGHISDRTRSRWGRRRPYFLISALPLWLLNYFIWAPSTSLSPIGAFYHVLICYMLLYTFWTIFYIPYYSLGMELTPNYNERTRLFGVQQIIGIIGVILGVLAPVIFTRAAGGSQIIGYPWMGIVIGGFSATFILITFFRTRERQDVAKMETFSFLRSFVATIRNRPYVILMLAYMMNLIGQSFLSPLCIYMAKYVSKTEWLIQPIILMYMIISLASIPLWLFISKKIDKKMTWSVAMLIGAIGYATIFFSSEKLWWIWVIGAIPAGAASGCSVTLQPSILADVIDSDELETGTRREGAFFGIRSFVDKASTALAVFIGLQALDLMGFVPNVEQTETVKICIKGLISLLPAAFMIMAILILRLFPITKEVHDDIRAQLDTRRGSQVVAESAGS